MKKKALFTLTSISIVTLSICIGVVAFTGNNNIINVRTRADQTYSLTIDTSNVSNFSYVEEGLYRGIFKTALGNDVIFTTNKQGNPLSDNKIYWNVDNYLKSETALTGLKSIEVTASTNIGDMAPYRNYPTIRAEMLVDPNQPESFYYVDKTTNTRDSKTYTMSIDEEGSGNYVNLKMVDIAEGAEGQLIISSIKFYFSCSNTVNPITVASSNDSYGTVSIEGSDNKRTVVKYGTSVTVHANPTSDFENELFYSFKGWHLNGSEEFISTNPDYTFTTVKDASYSLVAEFVEESKEVFTEGVRLCSSGDYGILHDEEEDTFVKSYDGAYYGFESGCEGSNYQNLDERGNGNLWRQYANGQKMPTPYLILNKNHDNYYYKEDEHSIANKVTVKDFDPSVVSCIELVFDKNSSYARDDLSISGGATSFGHTKKSITDTDSKTISKFFITNFGTSNIKISIPDKIESQYFFQLKRVVVHYKVVIPELQND